MKLWLVDILALGKREQLKHIPQSDLLFTTGHSGWVCAGNHLAVVLTTTHPSSEPSKPNVNTKNLPINITTIFHVNLD